VLGGPQSSEANFMVQQRARHRPGITDLHIIHAPCSARGNGTCRMLLSSRKAEVGLTQPLRSHE